MLQLGFSAFAAAPPLTRRVLRRFFARPAAVGALAAGLALGSAAGAAAQQQPATPAQAPAEDAGPSPRGAFFRSLVVPGWGQAWVGAPVRGGVYFALEAGSLWMTYKSRQKLREARVHEQWLRDTGQLQVTELYPLARAREDQVEDWLTLSIFLMFFAGADAWVSAHLVDVSEHIGVTPAPGGGLQMQARVPVGGRR